MASPASVRFDPDVLARLNAYVAAHPGMSLSGASNRLVDEALRSQEHPLVVFQNGPAGRRARLAGGPDIWEVMSAIRSARVAEPELSADEILTLVAETAGLSVAQVRAAVDYWAAYPDDIDALVGRARREQDAAEDRWQREQALLERDS